LQFGLADIPEIDASVREALQGRLIREGIDRLFEELATVDPAAAATMDPTKSQRIVRALEVYHGTGRALSAFHGQVTPPAFQYSTFVIQRERKALYERIDRRAEAMLDDGLIDEVKGLIQGDYDLSLPVFRTIGYREPLQFLRGEIDREEMVRLLKRNTRRYAKRQLTWFRRFDAYTWVDTGRATQTILACNDR
jgi:tRNA dimethylallyltransferase